MTVCRRFTICLWLAGILLASLPATFSEEVEQAPAPVTVGTRHALIVCGLPGDADHRKLFAETIQKLHSALTGPYGFAAADVAVLFGTDPQADDLEPLKSARKATREELATTVKTIREKLQADDTLWVIVLGHTHYDGRHSWLNLPGPDLQQFEFAELFQDVKAREQLFVITTPASGFYIKPLAASGRIIITATDADWETNETEFPHEFAKVLAEQPPRATFDIDQDDKLTLFDLYITVVRNLAQSYLDRQFLSTEHALLEDDGDGRGTELQIDYLSVDQGGRISPVKQQAPRPITRGDGLVAKTLLLPEITPAPAIAPAAVEQPAATTESDQNQESPAESK